ncbi:restriction endonuclease [Leeuwenhoekiella aequorea]|uniref:restriction endonuclease n=1 Tax=Leeuwenhoekiella aequorea TaxID=283736 RepID=UPI00352EF3E8|tara:strand:- start:20769 stop:21671 length:903 start_codon:yes stop_codon:yes gene_type:complete
MNWQEYEKQVYEELKSIYIDEEIIFNHSVIGRYSKRSRQIDVYIREKVGNEYFITIVDCKFYNKKVNVKSVEEFISMADDIGADYGLMVTERGYSSSALKRAANNPKNIQLDILNFKELKHNLQGEVGLPFVGDLMILMRSPFGWITDVSSKSYTSNIMYPRGNDIEDVKKGGEYGYIGFWDYDKDPLSIRQLSEMHNEALRTRFAVSDYSLIDVGSNFSKKAKIRTTRMIDRHWVEIAGYVLFERYIMYAVINSHKENVRINQNKIRLLIKYSIPLKIKNRRFAEVKDDENLGGKFIKL